MPGVEFTPHKATCYARTLEIGIEMGVRTIAIIGGGPAGARNAEILAQGWALHNGARGGHRVLIFEEKIGWEKPCGGGLSHKALRKYPFLAEATGCGKLVREVEFWAPNDEVMRFHLRRPMVIYSRATLNGLLLQRAQEAGAEVIADRIVDLRRRNSDWELAGRQGNYHADFVVLAAGARTRLRREFVQDFTQRDFMLTFGYYVPIESDLLRVQFYEEFEGYAWAFPRPDHLSVGICGKIGEDCMAGLRDRFRAFHAEIWLCFGQGASVQPPAACALYTKLGRAASGRAGLGTGRRLRRLGRPFDGRGHLLRPALG